MKPILIAIHGILTRQTDASWPDKLDAWMYRRDPAVKVLKKEYAAGPFPRWNCWVKDPLLARGLVNEIELFLEGEGQPGQTGQTEAPGRLSGETVVSRSHALTLSCSDLPAPSPSSPPIWFVAHSNGAVIALRAARTLIARGHRVGGLILTGAACEADVEKNGVMEWRREGVLGAAIAYCSEDDEVLDGDPEHSKFRERPGAVALAGHWLWGKLMWPYGCLGRTGWLVGGRAVGGVVAEGISTRWFEGGHSTYFAPGNIQQTFDQIYQDISSTSPLLTPASPLLDS
jgi:hypothetical protein